MINEADELEATIYKSEGKTMEAVRISPNKFNAD